jgi:trimethylamine--corrinoid protein Co-methyltransferase
MKNLRMDVISDEETRQIHAKTVELLETVGMFVGHPEARKMLKDVGCEVDEKKEMVKIPEAVIDKYLALAPKKISLYSYDGKHDVVLDSVGDKVHYMTFGAGTRVTTYEGHGRFSSRDSTLKDLGESVHVAEYCDNIDMITTMVSAVDYAKDPVRTLKELKEIVTNSSKIGFCESDISILDAYFEFTVAMFDKGEEYARTHPHFIFGSGPVSPMQLDYNACLTPLLVPKYGIPVLCLNMGMSGATMPIDLAGTIVCNNAEIIAEIILTQVAYPGAPVIYGSTTTEFDLWCNTAPVGSPELALISSAAVKLAHYYQIPSLVGGI